MKQYAAPIFIYLFITVFIATWVYVGNPIYQGQYLMLLGVSALITFIAFAFCFLIGHAYEVIDKWGNS